MNIICLSKILNLFYTFYVLLEIKCAHGDRIYSYKKDCVSSHYIPVIKYHTLLKLPINNKGPKYGREDILALFIAMKYFMKPKKI